MTEFLAFLDEYMILKALIRLVAATVMGGLIGSERGRHGRAAGLRTHILVCIGAAMTSLTSVYLSEVLGYTGDIARLSAQVISGIGFLGAGTILIRNNSIITGLTTAAGMWATAAIGVAVGYGFYMGAAIATVICIGSVTLLSRLEKQRKSTLNAYIELSDIKLTEEIIALLRKENDLLISYDIIPPKSNISGNVGILATVNETKNFASAKEKIKSIPEAVILVTDINT